jgi:hypothetical protein
MQTEFALSSTKAEYIGLSRALREAIPIMAQMKEMQSLGFTVASTTPIVKCKVFEDNTGALEMATIHRIHPRTKHINVKYHHFRSYVDDGSIQRSYIQSQDNVADMITKGQPVALLRVHRLAVLGWDTAAEKGCDNTSYKANANSYKANATSVGLSTNANCKPNHRARWDSHDRNPSRPDQSRYETMQRRRDMRRNEYT